jgi:hypothetical protein
MSTSHSTNESESERETRSATTPVSTRPARHISLLTLTTSPTAPLRRAALHPGLRVDHDHAACQVNSAARM